MPFGISSRDVGISEVSANVASNLLLLRFLHEWVQLLAQSTTTHTSVSIKLILEAASARSPLSKTGIQFYYSKADAITAADVDPSKRRAPSMLSLHHWWFMPSLQTYPSTSE